jgi:hypothetical protein
MASGCRDCSTCTKPGLAKLAQNWMIGLLHLCTAGISWAVKRATSRHCPQCSHRLASHARRPDGSFAD